jgi:dolichol-phosphate mannosyltransferase
MATPPLVLGQIARQYTSTETPLELSLVAPVYEEEENLRPLHQSVVEAMAGREGWELVLVDDGSSDRSPDLIRELAAEDPRVVGVFFEHNCGQTAAMGAGIAVARGELIATLDSDLQNDPRDIVGMLDVLGEADAVVGYRQKRNDNWVRRISSKIANGVRNRISRDQIRDTGCSLKLFRAEAIRVIPLFEGMHRFFPTLLRYHGFEVLEHPVSHHPRIAGRSKYGVMNRAWRAFKDLLAVRWMRGRLIRIPIAEVVGRDRS